MSIFDMKVEQCRAQKVAFQFQMDVVHLTHIASQKSLSISHLPLSYLTFSTSCSHHVLQLAPQPKTKIPMGPRKVLGFTKHSRRCMCVRERNFRNSRVRDVVAMIQGLHIGCEFGVVAPGPQLAHIHQQSVQHVVDDGNILERNTQHKIGDRHCERSFR